MSQLGHALSACESNALSKLLLVPVQQGGHEMLTALASSGRAWLNVRSMTPLRHAKSLLEWYGKPDTRFLSGTAAALLVEKLLQESSVPMSNPVRRASSSVAATIRELRLANVNPDRYEDTGDTSYGRSITQIYKQYISHVNEHAMLDEAGVFKRATEVILHDNSLDLPILVMILDEVMLTNASLAYVQAVGRRAQSAYRIGFPLRDMDLPSHVAGRLLSDWPVRGFDVKRISENVSEHVSENVFEKNSAGFQPSCTFETRSAVGADNEIRSAFQKIVSDELSLDSVEIAYTAHDPYLRVIRSLASRYAIPVTLAAGVPAFSTRTGQAIKHFIDWILDGHSSRILVEMLRAGLIDLGNSATDAQPIAMAAADWLATVRIAQGTASYAFVFDNQQRSLSEAAKRARGTFMQDAATAASRKHDELVLALKPLLELGDLTGKTRLSELARRIERLLARFVHASDVSADMNAEVDSNESNDDFEKLDDADFERIAARDLITRFNQLGEEIQEAIPLTPLLTHVLEMLSSAFVRARAAAPGSVHVVPLSSAGYSGRCNLFVVGMDELTMGKTRGENPLLSDAQRQILERENGHSLTLSSDSSHRQSWHFDRAVSKVVGIVTLLYSRYDVADDRELYPSSVFLRIRSHPATELKDEIPATYVSFAESESQTFPLDLTEVSIRARKTPEAQSWLSEHYPWIERGRIALHNRASAQWTHFDGQLGIETGALNPFRGKSRLSASRLETLINCPFKYFLKYILKARAPDEAEEDVWLDALERGSLIHRALARYMSERGQEPISAHDITALENVLFIELEEYAASRTAPNPAVEAAIRAELSAVARAFIADEKERQLTAEPLAFEFGFGLWPHMKKEALDRTEAVTIDLEGLSVPLLGWVDRIDKAHDGGIFITDYKTGSSIGYNPTDLLNRGRSLQWALYAYVVEQLLGEPVLRSGYLFPGSREMGRRIEADPTDVRDEVADHLRRMGRMANSGAFFQAADDEGACRYCDYMRVCGEIASVKGHVRSKMNETTPATPQYELLDGWHYAEKKLRRSN